MENPNFHLEAVVRERNELQDFEGPLSLILMLLQKNKIEIRDVSISEILDQYLAWMDEMQRMDLEIASEFVQMAAHLLYIKTRTLLTGDEEAPEPLPKTKREYEYKHEPVDLLKALYTVFSRGVRASEEEDTIARAIPKRIVYSIRDKSRQILGSLRAGPSTLKALYEQCASRSEVVATFMSVLEMCSMGSIHIDRRDGDYVVEFVGGDVDEILEKIVDE